MFISVIIPVYNEESGLESFWQSLCKILDKLSHQFEVWFINDGSTDGTETVIRKIMAQNPHVKLLSLSRNFGHQIALTAGIDHADGDVVISMDGDGQHPPELIPKLLELYDQGFEIVLTQRQTDDESIFKRLTSRLFYRLINFLSDTPVLSDSADFRLTSRKVILGLRQTREYHRFLRGLVSWMGFRHTVLPFKQPSRLTGKSGYSLRKMVHLASDAIFSFSTIPMKLSIFMGCGFMILACWQLAETLFKILAGRSIELVPGWTSLIFSILGAAGVQLIMLGVLGQYVGKIFQETKRRPLYFLQEISHPRNREETLVRPTENNFFLGSGEE
jgi:dolichol-phosphate mannosyltransferase